MPDASMPHSSGPEVSEQLTGDDGMTGSSRHVIGPNPSPADARPTCERCRRPEVTVDEYLDWQTSRDLLEPSSWAGMCLTSVLSAIDPECDRLLLAERDALAEAGDALAATVAQFDRDPTVAAWQAVTDQFAAWRALRSPKETGNG